MKQGPACYLFLILVSIVERIKPKVLQNRFYADSGYDRELRAFCLETGPNILSWSKSGRCVTMCHRNLRTWTIFLNINLLNSSSFLNWTLHQQVSECWNWKQFLPPIFLCIRQMWAAVSGARFTTQEKGIKYQSFWTLTANPHVLDSWPHWESDNQVKLFLL